MTVWMGMTVRNVLYGQTIEALNKKFSVTILSNYADLLSKVLCQYELKYEKLRVPRWQFPSLQAVLIKRLYEWNYLALWFKKKPSTADDQQLNILAENAPLYDRKWKKTKLSNKLNLKNNNFKSLN